MKTVIIENTPCFITDEIEMFTCKGCYFNTSTYKSKSGNCSANISKLKTQDRCNSNDIIYQFSLKDTLKQL